MTPASYFPLLTLLALSPAPIPPEITQCLKPIEAEGELGRGPLNCAFDYALGADALPEALRAVEALELSHPKALWAPHTAGNILKTMGQLDDAAEAFERSAKGFEGAGEVEGQVLGLLSLALVRGAQGEVEAGEIPLGRAAALAGESGNPTLVYTTHSVQANWTLSNGGDLFEAYSVLKEAQGALVPDGPPGLQALVLDQLSYLSYTLGWEDEGLAYLNQSQALKIKTGDDYEAADGAFEALLRREQALEWRGDPEAQLKAIDALRPLADTSGNALVTARLACMAAPHIPQGPAQEAELSRCEALSAATGLEDSLADAALSRMQVRWPGPGTEEALDTLASMVHDEALDAEWGPMVHFLRARHSFERGDTDEAMARSAELFDAIDAVSGDQGVQAFQARVFSGWVFAYQDIARRLLDLGRLEEAVALVELSRGRELREWLGRVEGFRGGEAAEDALGRWRRALQAIDSFNRRSLLALDDGGGGDLGTLRALEAEEAKAREALVRGGPSGPPPRGVSMALEEVERALQPGEALLSFQLPEVSFHSPEPPPQPWVLGVHPGGHHWETLPSRERLTLQIEQLLGLLSRGDGRYIPGAEALYQGLLSGILEAMPPETQRLYLVVDGPLHSVPFPVLQPPGGQPLGGRMGLVSVSSIGAFLRAQAQGSVTPPGNSLVLGVGDAPPWVGAPWEPPRAFPKLPWVIEESKAVVAHLGESTALALGVHGTEARVRAFAANPGPVLHMGAHSVVDDRMPDRSAILLSPGAESGDGLLRPPEILSLGIKGSLVFLSSCQSARGEALDGEGSWGMAQAFLQGGAGAVIGGLWPLEDRPTKAFVDHFYRAYGAGKLADVALREAQAAMMDAGHPPRVWGGFVLMGSQGPRLFKEAPEGRGASPWVWGGLALVALGLGMVFWGNRYGA